MPIPNLKRTTAPEIKPGRLAEVTKAKGEPMLIRQYDGRF